MGGADERGLPHPEAIERMRIATLGWD